MCPKTDEIKQKKVVNVETLSAHHQSSNFCSGSPEDVERELIEEDLTTLSGVAGVHGLHVWSLTMDRNVISVHLSVGKYTDRGLGILGLLCDFNR